MCQKASECKLIVGKMDADDKNKVLCDAADLLVQNIDTILAENAKDIENAKTKGMEKGMIDRLTLTVDRIADMAEGLREVARLSIQLEKYYL